MCFIQHTILSKYKIYVYEVEDTQYVFIIRIQAITLYVEYLSFLLFIIYLTAVALDIDRSTMM